MPAPKTLKVKYKSLEDELLKVREHLSGVEMEKKELKKKLLNLSRKIKNLYYSLSD